MSGLPSAFINLDERGRQTAHPKLWRSTATYGLICGTTSSSRAGCIMERRVILQRDGWLETFRCDPTATGAGR